MVERIISPSCVPIPSNVFCTTVMTSLSSDVWAGSRIAVSRRLVTRRMTHYAILRLKQQRRAIVGGHQIIELRAQRQAEKLRLCLLQHLIRASVERSHSA